MSEQHRLRVESIVLEAADRDISERSAFLDEACAGNDSLRRDVESLLRFESDADRFLQRPAMETAAQLATDDVAFDAAHLRIDGYEIAEFLGAGGMGEVYRAWDVRLERAVAVKIIRHAPHDDTTPTRLEEEARAASRLNHPNVVTVHAVGSQAGVSYIVMELVTGRTLRDLLAAGPLPLSSTLEIAVQLADSLAAAHETGVIHRDLKPENVMVTPTGLVKVLDFGIARRHVGVGDDSPGAMSPAVHTFSTTSRAGTAGYMAPEQALSGTIDHRSDQYSFGAIVYEMLEGERPSASAAPSRTSSAREHAELGAIIERCLAPRADRRYAHTRELATVLREVRSRLLHAQRGLTRRQMVSAAALTCSAIAAALWRFPSIGGGIRRLAVMPFVNKSADPQIEILCDGITRVLILQLTQLRHLTGLTPIGHTSVFLLKGLPNEPRDVGKRLGVDAVLNGSVSTAGERIKVHVELVDADTGGGLWATELDRHGADVLEFQNEIAVAIITTGLGIEASDATLRELSRGLTSDSQAYLLYLQALHYIRLGRETDYLESRSLLVDALERDEQFAHAHVTLASTHSIMAIDGHQRPLDAWRESRRHIERALTVDPGLPEAHAERGVELFFYKWDWAGSEREWDKALRSRRAVVQGELYSPYVLQQWALGRNDQAIRFAKAGREVDPLSPMLLMREADILATVGDLSAALDRYATIIKTAPDPTAALVGLAQVHRKQRRYDEAIEALRRAFAEWEDEALASILAAARGADGCRTIDRYLAERELAGLSDREAEGKYASPLDRARACARLEQVEEAFAFLEAAFEDRAAALVFLNVDPAWDNMRGDRRFHASVRRVGLVPNQRGGS